MNDDPNGFGYRSEPTVFAVESVQVAEGKRADTLQPAVVLYLRTLEHEERLAFALAPDLADLLATELVQWAQRAREKHYE